MNKQEEMILWPKAVIVHHFTDYDRLKLFGNRYRLIIRLKTTQLHNIVVTL